MTRREDNPRGNVSVLTFEYIDPDEILGSEVFRFVERFLASTRRTEIGWHYITDIAWIYSKVKRWPRGYRILDAGGGGGPLQFLLAELGFHVTNIDMVLPEPRPVYFKRYDLSRRQLSHFMETGYAGHIRRFSRPGGWPFLRRILRAPRALSYAPRHDRWRSDAGLSDVRIGRIEWVAGNLCDLREIPAGTFDAVVSLSALEHIPTEHLETALTEISRVLVPHANWAVTTSGTDRAMTWLHEPSQGWCYSEADLVSRFGAVRARDQNPTLVLRHYRECAYLKDHLAVFYRRGENNGMPMGIWDPKYIPVGLSR